MQKNAPTLGRILVMAGFALSCGAILMYLWLTFGGSIPLKPKGYRVSVDVPEAPTLAQEADVRISGVPVGKVKKKSEVTVDGRVQPLTHVEMEIDSKYAPIPNDTRAILRQKTLLGETYVELTPGSKNAQKVPDGGSLANGQVAPTVELDEIFRAFDRRTRTAFRQWLQQQGVAVDGRGEDLNAALGNLEPFARDLTSVLKILDEQSESTRQLVRNTGVVFEALTERDGQLRDLITNSNQVFAATARRSEELKDAIRAFPTFLDESRTTTVRLTKFANDTDPLVQQLRPAAREISPTLIKLRDLAPELKGLFRDLDPLITAANRGLPATEKFLDETRPLLAQLDPFLRNLNPILDWLGLYRREVAAFFANSVAATNAGDPGGAKYLRTTNPVNPEVLASSPKRYSTTRNNPYFAPGGYDDLPTGLKVFGSYLCTSNPVPAVNSVTNPIPGAPPVPDFLPQSTYALIDQFVYGGQPPASVAAPPCKEQAPLGQIIGQTGRYPHVFEAPERP
jgi:phospholipid/cholesterol/gamma-HCH transport system substrate-binding protein